MHVHDHERPERIGMPEAVLCSSKSTDQLREIVDDLRKAEVTALFTRMSSEQYHGLKMMQIASLDFDAVSGTAILGDGLPTRPGNVAIVAAGTSDQSVAAEAARTLSFSGVANEQIIDVGVAGPWRLQARLDEIKAADIVIVVAGMDAALVSVLGGLIGSPIIAVPTSVGYGVAEGGSTALNSALASCAQGVTVVNIDNGFGAACAAVRMLSLFGGARLGPQDARS